MNFPEVESPHELIQIKHNAFPTRALFFNKIQIKR